MDAAIETILSNTFTDSDVYKRLAILQDALEHSLYTTNAKTSLRDMLAERYVGSDDRTSLDAIAAWGEAVVSLFHSGDIGKHMDALKKSIAAVPSITLYVAAPMPAAAMNEIGAWCRQNIDPHVLIDLKIDRSSAGGCMLVWKNTLHDFSMRYFLHKHEKELADLLHGNKHVVVDADI